MNRASALVSAALIAVPGSLLAPQTQSQTTTPPSPSMQQGQPMPGMKPLVVAVTAKMTAIVEDIDPVNRTLLLRGEGGREAVVKAGKEARNFDQIKKGDRITAEYLEATAIAVRKPEALAISGAPGAPTADRPGIEQMSVVEVAAPGQPPAGMEATVTEITATVEDVDYANRKVTLKGPLGNLRTISVGQEVKNLDEVKKGDQIVIRHTEAVLVAVTN